MEKQLIPTHTLCSRYNIEISFVNALNQMGLIEIEVVKQTQYIHRDQISAIEKIIRLHYDLNVNLEGIDVVLNLLEKEHNMRQELNRLKNRLRLYENE